MNMNQQRHPIASALGSIIGVVIFIGLFIVGLIFFSYLLIIGGIIGLVLFLIAYIRAKFFAKKIRGQAKKQKQAHHGRTIDHNDVG